MSITCNINDRIANAKKALTNKILTEIQSDKPYIQKVNDHTLKVLYNTDSKIQNLSMATMVAKSLADSKNKKYTNSVFFDDNYIQIFPSKSLLQSQFETIERVNNFEDNIGNYIDINEEGNEYFYNGELYTTKDDLIKAMKSSGIYYSLYKDHNDNYSIPLRTIEDIKNSLSPENFYEELGISHIIDNQSFINSLSAELQDLFKLVNKYNPDVTINIGTRHGNQFDETTNVLDIDFYQIKALSVYSGLDAKVVMESVIGHELKHALNVYALKDVKIKTKVQEFFNSAKELYKTNPFVDDLRKGFVLDNGLPYAFKNEAEFLSEMSFNPTFKKWMMNAKTKEGDSLWDRIIKFFADLLGIERFPKNSIYNKLVGIESSKEYLDAVYNNSADSLATDVKMGLKIYGIMSQNDVDDRTDLFSEMKKAIYKADFQDVLLDSFDDLVKNITKIKYSQKERGEKGYDKLTVEGKAISSVLESLKANKGLDEVRSSIATISALSQEMQEMLVEVNEQNKSLKSDLEKVNHLYKTYKKAQSFKPYIYQLQTISSKLKIYKDEISNKTPENEEERKQIANIVSKFNNINSLLAKGIESASTIEIYIKDLLLGTEKVNALNNKSLSIEQREEILKEISELPLFKAFGDTVDFKYTNILASNQEIKDKIKELEEKLKNESSFIGIKIYTDKIKEKKAELNKSFEDSSFFVKELLGEFGDITSSNVYLDAAFMSRSKVVQQGEFLYSKQFSEGNRFAQQEANFFQQQLIDKLLKGNSKFDVKKLYDKIITKQTYIISKKDDASYDQDERLAFLNNYTDQYMIDFQSFRLDLQDLRDKYYAEKNEDKKRELKEAIDIENEEFKSFIKENVLAKFTEEYDKMVELNNEVLDEKGTTLKSFTGDILTQIDEKRKERKSTLDGDRKLELTNDIRNLQIQLGDRTSTFGKEEDSIEFKIAKQYEKYRELRNKIYKSEDELGDNAYDWEAFNKAYKQAETFKNNGLMSQEDWDIWLEENTQKVLSDTFKAQQDELRADAKDLSDRLAKLLNVSSEKTDYYEQIYKIVAKYRNNESIIRGDLVKESEAEEIKRLQIAQDEFDLYVEGLLSDLNKADLARKIELQSLKGSKTEAEKQELLDLIQKEKDRKASFEENKTEVAVLRKSLKAVRKELFDLTTTSTTIFYKNEIDKQRDILKEKFIQELIQFPDNEEISFDSNIYLKLNNKWYNKGTGKEDTEFINKYTLMRVDVEFKNTDWWERNHFDKLTWDEDSSNYVYTKVPIYIWNYSKPKEKDEKNPVNLVNKPSIIYRNYEVKDEFYNKEYKEIRPGFPYPKKTADVKYINQAYYDLQKNDPKMFEVLETLRIKYLEYQGFVEKESRLGDILPSARMTDKEALVRRGKAILDIDGLKSAAKEFWNTNIKRNEQDLEYEGIMSKNSVTEGVIPLMFSGRITAEEQSYNALNSILQYGTAAYRRTLIEEINPLMESLYLFAKDKDKVTIKNKVVKKDGKIIIQKVVESVESNTSKALRELINTRSYNESTKTLDLGGNIDANKLTSKVLKWTSFSAFALNVFSPIKNLLSGKGQAFIRTSLSKNADKGFYSMKNALKAEIEFGKQLPNIIQDIPKLGDKSIISQMIDRFQAIQGFTYDKFGKKTEWSSLTLGGGNPIDNLSILKEFSEYQLQTASFIAMAMDKMIKHSSGDVNKSISLYEAFEKAEDGNLKLKDGYILTKEEEDAFIRKVRDYNLRVNGAYGMDRNNAQKEIWGKVLFFMSGYLVPGIQDRYKKSTINLNTGDYETGFYRTGVSFIKDLVKYKLELKKVWGTLSETEKQEVNRFLRETLTTIVFFILVSSLVLGPDPEHPIKDYSNTQLFLLTTLMAVKSEFETFNPVFGANELIRRGKNPFIAMKTIDNIRKFLVDISYAIGGVDAAKYQKKTFMWEKGDYKFVADLAKLITVSPGNAFTWDLDALYKQVKSYQ